MKIFSGSQYFVLSLVLLTGCAQQNSSTSDQSIQSQNSAPASYPAHLATVEQRTAALNALPPGGPLYGRHGGSCTYANSTARVIFTSGTPDGAFIDIPPDIKARIQAKLTQELSKTNFTISSFSDGAISDYQTPGGGAIPGIITISMFIDNARKASSTSAHAGGFGGQSAVGVSYDSDGNCTGKAWGSVSLHEGRYDDKLLLHEFGHALGLVHTEAYRWRDRYLMPQIIAGLLRGGLIFLGSPDKGSVMALGDTFSEGDVRVINFLYPTRGGQPREIHNYKPGTEIESGIMVIRSFEEKALRVHIPSIDDPVESRQMPATKGPLHSAVRQDQACVFAKATYFAIQQGVKESGLSAAEHYCRFGFAENRIICLPDTRPNDKAIIKLCEPYGGVMEPSRGTVSGLENAAPQSTVPLTWRAVDATSDYDRAIARLTGWYACPAHIVEGATCDVRGYACNRGHTKTGLVCAAPEDPIFRWF